MLYIYRNDTFIILHRGVLRCENIVIHDECSR
jgi:hypothetical protein